jgi:peptidyl-Lys metalloendopeptidase
MSLLKAVKKYAVLGLLGFLATASLASAGVRDLTATISTEKSFLEASDDAVVLFTLFNPSNEDVYIASWQTPVRGIEGNIFDVRKNGVPVAYTGRLYKRGAPTAADYVRIPAGGAVSARVDLSSAYDMNFTGEYTIRYQTRVQDALRGVENALQGDAVRNLESNAVIVGAERIDVPEFAIDDAVVSATAPYLTPGYVSCSTTRQSSLVTALANAESISLKARNYLSGLSTTARSTDAAFKTWFGAYTSSHYSTVQTHYNNIYSTFNTKKVTFYCDCTDSSYAYVYANRPYEIHLCGAFWNAPSLGTDSKAGTLVHETSHFSVVAGTQDYAYGTTACKNLAISNSTRAINNADSHEYFAETR